MERRRQGDGEMEMAGRSIENEVWRTQGEEGMENEDGEGREKGIWRTRYGRDKGIWRMRYGEGGMEKELWRRKGGGRMRYGGQGEEWFGGEVSSEYCKSK